MKGGDSDVRSCMYYCCWYFWCVCDYCRHHQQRQQVIQCSLIVPQCERSSRCLFTNPADLPRSSPSTPRGGLCRRQQRPQPPYARSHPVRQAERRQFHFCLQAGGRQGFTGAHQRPRALQDRAAQAGAESARRRRRQTLQALIRVLTFG